MSSITICILEEVARYFQKRVLSGSLWIIIGAAAMSSHCGYYSFSGSTLPSNIKTVAIPTFLDDTEEFGIRERLTGIITETFNRDPNLKVVDRKTADSIILGRILNINDSPYTFDESERTSQYKFVITVEISFENLKNKEIIWEDKLTAFGIYNEGERTSGIDEAVEKMSEDIINNIVAGW